MITFKSMRHCGLCSQPIQINTPAQQTWWKKVQVNLHLYCYIQWKIRWHQDKIARLEKLKKEYYGDEV